MPTRKRDRTLARRHFGYFALLGVPFLICLVVAVRYPGHFCMAWAIAVVIGITGLVTQEMRFRRFRCPDCGAMLRYERLPPGSPIEYHCERCDVIWETGFSESTGD